MLYKQTCLTSPRSFIAASISAMICAFFVCVIGLGSFAGTAYADEASPSSDGAGIAALADEEGLAADGGESPSDTDALTSNDATAGSPDEGDNDTMSDGGDGQMPAMEDDSDDNQADTAAENTEPISPVVEETTVDEDVAPDTESGITPVQEDDELVIAQEQEPVVAAEDEDLDTAVEAEPATLTVTPAAVATQPASSAANSSASAAITTNAPAQVTVKAQAVAIPKDISKATITVADAIYTGSAITPTVKVVFDGKELTPNRHYTVSYSNNTKTGKATVTITGINTYKGVLSKTFTIYGAPSYTAGATKMPVLSTSKWILKNATLERTSGSSITISGSTVKAVKAGKSVVTVFNKIHGKVKSITINVYNLNGVYVIKSSLGNSMVLDIDGAQKTNEANVHIYEYNKTKAQYFTFKKSGSGYIISNVNSGKALDVVGASTQNRANVQQYEKNGTKAQLWTIRVDSKNRLAFFNAASGKVLDVEAGRAKNLTNVHQYASNGTPAQRWVLAGVPSTAKGATKMPMASTAKWSVTYRGSIKLLSGSSVTVSGKTVKAVDFGTSKIAILDSMGKRVATKTVTVYPLNTTYFIRSGIKSTYALQIEDHTKNNGANICLESRYGVPSQGFIFSRSGDAYVIKSAYSKKVLDVAGGSKQNGANVQQYASNGTNAQKWRITVDSANRLTFLNVNSGKALDVSGGIASAGRNVHQYKSNGTLAQKWTLQTYVSSQFKPGDYLAAAAVALAGCYGSGNATVPTNSGKQVANNMRPTGSGWAVYNKVHDKVGPNVYTKGMYSSTKYYTDCGGNVALAVGWSGIDDGYIRSCSARQQEQYMKDSNKWDQVGKSVSFKDVADGKVKLKPGDIISINGYSHVAIFTGETATSVKYGNGAPATTYYEAQLSAKQWAHLVNYSTSKTTFNVYRRNATNFNYKGSTYYSYMKSEREKYLVAGR